MDLQPPRTAPPDAQTPLALALRTHWSGDLDGAEAMYRQILQMWPSCADAWNLLGALARQRGRPNEGLEMVRRAIALRGDVPAYFNNLGLAARDCGAPEEAIEACERAIALRPDYPQAHGNLANALMDVGRIPQAIAACQRVAALRPDWPQAWGNLAKALKQAGRLDEAIDAYRRALALKADWSDVHNALGIALRETRRFDEAMAAHEAAITLRPDYAEAWNNLGNARFDSRLLAEAVAAYQRAIELRPGYASAWNNLGTVLRTLGRIDSALDAYERSLNLQGDQAIVFNNLGVALADAARFEEAITAYERAIALDASYAQAHANLGVAHCDLGRKEQAIAACERALKLKPDLAVAHCNLSMVLLRLGELARGWVEHEWRWRRTDRAEPRAFDQPMWEGGELAGRTILLHEEQGFGDTIQFARYAPLVARLGGRVILECQPELLRVMRTMQGVDRVIPFGAPIGAFDAHCPLLSLPYRFNTTLQTIPAAPAYLSADARDEQVWRERLRGNERTPLRVGLVWAGNPKHTNDANRSMALADFAPLADVADVAFHSLQKGPSPAATQAPPPGLKLMDHAALLEDFADTAALIANLDLVISVDTAVAHLAAALGREVWILLPLIPEWRWMIDQEDSPWYPSARLFRQTRFRDWSQPVARVTRALHQRAAAHAQHGGNGQLTASGQCIEPR
jgi:tetratricopeptide (TPR) repeat protein